MVQTLAADHLERSRSKIPKPSCSFSIFIKGEPSLQFVVPDRTNGEGKSRNINGFQHIFCGNSSLLAPLHFFITRTGFITRTCFITMTSVYLLLMSAARLFKTSRVNPPKYVYLCLSLSMSQTQATNYDNCLKYAHFYQLRHGG